MQNRRYEVNFTDKNIQTLVVPRRIFINDLVDVTLIGKRTLEYGQILNENILHLLEHFACPAIDNETFVPDPDKKLETVLNNPIVGQLWYNTTVKCLCSWNGTQWKTFLQYGDISGNSGFIYDGEKIPTPVNGRGIVANKNRCSVHVSPMFIGRQHGEIECEIVNDIVKCAYYDPEWYPNGASRNPTYASYIVICDDSGEAPPTPTPLPTPTPTPLPVVWDGLHTGTGGIIMQTVFTTSDIAFSPATRTTKKIGEKSYISCTITSPDKTRLAYVGIGDGTLNTTTQGFRPGLTPFGIEVTNNGKVLIGSTETYTITDSVPLNLEFAISGRMVWVRRSGTLTWLGGGSPESLTNPTIHIAGTDGLYLMAGSNGNVTASVTFADKPEFTTGIVPVGFIAASFQ